MIFCLQNKVEKIYRCGSWYRYDGLNEKLNDLRDNVGILSNKDFKSTLRTHMQGFLGYAQPKKNLEGEKIHTNLRGKSGSQDGNN